MGSSALVLWVLVSGTLFGQGDSVEEKIRVVCPGTSASMVTMMADEISGFHGAVSEDVVIAVAKVESNCTHLKKRGLAGEWGMLQVIPYDGHIRDLVARYRCSPVDAQDTILLSGVRRKMCLPDGRLDVWVGDKLSGFRVEAMLQHSARVAFRVGIWELNHWKQQYQLNLRERYWRRFPAHASGPYSLESFRKWWYSVSVALGEDVWVVHHNYGPRMAHGGGPRAYPFSILRVLQELRGKE